LISASKTLSSDIPFPPGSAVEGVILRGYATTSKKRTSAKKKVTKKKAKKPAKKKAATKRKVAKKPKKPTRPKVLDIPSSRALSGYTIFIQDQLKLSTGQSAASRLIDAVEHWKSLSDFDKQVPFLLPPLHY
jgi:hypothetical protein